ncbi:MAG: tyrosine--tRNA ligase [Acidobacteriota bacterium]
MNLFDDLQSRGLIYDFTEGAKEKVTSEKVTAYIGFDPTAASLHVGSLLPIMCLARLQRYGHTPIAIVGGGTGLIGDPSGKAKERLLLTKELVEENLQGIKKQLELFLDFESATNPAQIINNADWLASISMIDFMRDVGKHFTVNSMLDKESVKRRLEKEEGISFTEFSYSLLQAYDFLVLNEKSNCTLQMGGSDQWGNIIAGIDLIRRVKQTKAYGIVFPLVTTSTGVKFGKTEAGAVWLDGKLTSPYRFYQFWLNTTDADTITYLKYFTWLSIEEINELAAAMQAAPEKREAQKRLASELTRTLHGEAELANAIKASEALFGGDISDLRAEAVLDIFNDVPSSEIQRNDFAGEGIGIVDLFAQSKLVPSKGEARRLVESGGAYLNNHRLTDVKKRVSSSDFIDNQFLVLRKGQKQYHLIKVIG